MKYNNNNFSELLNPMALYLQQEVNALTNILRKKEIQLDIKSMRIKALEQSLTNLQHQVDEQTEIIEDNANQITNLMQGWVRNNRNAAIRHARLNRRYQVYRRQYFRLHRLVEEHHPREVTEVIGDELMSSDEEPSDPTDLEE